MPKTILKFISVFFLLALTVQAQQSGRQAPTTTHIYELYSWQDPKGSWNFSLLPNTSSEKSVELVFSKKVVCHGLDQLKAKINLLPEGSTIALLNRLPTGTGPKAKGSESLTYPPPDVVGEIRRYTAARKIEVVGGSEAN
jgi:hypothetical protein